MANTVTIKIKPETKAMMEIFAALVLSSKGKSLTNDDIIAELVRLAAPEVYKQIKPESEDEKKAKK